MNALTRTLCTVTLVAIGLLTQPVAQANEPVYTQAELDQMLAPVALYPDTVLTHVLIAATYPVQVVRAARWSAENAGLEGEAALAAVDDRDWDDSVKALVAFPELLARMNDDLEWTQRVGDAFLAQEGAVLDTVQALRTRAYNAGNLQSSEKVRVVRETETIVIEPTVERIVYVPVYDTRVVYGPWWWSAHPPVHWSWPSRHYSSVGFYWGHGVHVRPTFYYSSFHWTNRHIIRGGGHRWHHQPRYYRPRGHVNRHVTRYAEDRPRVQANKPPIRRGIRPPISTPRSATSSRPLVQERRATSSRPVVQPRRTTSSRSAISSPTRSVSQPTTRSAPRMAAPRAAAPRAATTAPRASFSSPAAARAVPRSKPTTTRAPTASAPAPSRRSAPASAPRQQTSRPARQKER